MFKEKVINLQLFALQVTNLTALEPEIKEYYDTTLIDLAEPNLVYDQFGQKVNIPEGNGKSIEFRKFDSLPDVSGNPLQEGVTPASTDLNVEKITATVDQYGAYVELSDMLQLTAIDPIVSETLKRQGSQAGITRDTIVRNELVAGTNVLYAPNETTEVYSREDLGTSSLFTADTIFRAAAILKKMDAPTIDGDYIAIMHPYVAYDFMIGAKDRTWIDTNAYAAATKIFNGEIGKIGNVRVISSSHAKIFAAGKIFGSAKSVTVKTAISSSTTTVTINEAITSAEATAFTGPVDVYVNGVANTVTAVTAGTAGNASLTLGTAVTSVTANAKVCGKGGTKDGNSVFATMVLGADSYGVTELEGGGLEVIVNPLGYGNDPLKQRSSVGWKTTLVAKRLVEEYMLRVETVASKWLNTDAN